MVILHRRLQPQMPPKVLLAWGYQNGRAIGSVIFLVRESFNASRTWDRPLLAMQLDVKEIFEHLRHSVMLRGLRGRKLDARLRAAYARELFTLTGEARIRDAQPTTHVESPLLSLETLEAFFGPLVWEW